MTEVKTPTATISLAEVFMDVAKQPLDTFIEKFLDRKTPLPDSVRKIVEDAEATLNDYYLTDREIRGVINYIFNAKSRTEREVNQYIVLCRAFEVDTSPALCLFFTSTKTLQFASFRNGHMQPLDPNHVGHAHSILTEIFSKFQTKMGIYKWFAEHGRELLTSSRS